MFVGLKVVVRVVNMVSISMLIVLLLYFYVIRGMLVIVVFDSVLVIIDIW